MKVNKIVKLVALAACTTSAVFAMDTKKQQSNDLKVMTFNIRRKGLEKVDNHFWDNRKKAVIQMLQQQKPAVLGLQEATEDQITDLKKALKGYQEFGEGRGRVWYIDKSEHTPIFYNEHQIQKLQSGTFSLTPGLSASKWNPIWRLWKRYKKTPEWGTLPRICTYALFKDKNTNKEFYVFNTHLEHQLDSVRLKQLTLLLAKIKELVKDKTPVILMGDFNTNIAGPVEKIAITGSIAKLLQQNGFVNTKLKAKTKTGPAITQRGWSGTEKKIIDHVLLKNGQSVDVHSYNVLVPQKDTIWSDHYPVVVDLNIK